MMEGRRREAEVELLHARGRKNTVNYIKDLFFFFKKGNVY